MTRSPPACRRASSAVTRAGQLILLVETASGPVVLASDAIHYYEEMERDWPCSIVVDVPETYAGYELLRELARERHDADRRRPRSARARPLPPGRRCARRPRRLPPLTMALDERQRRLREEFLDSRGYWNEFLDGLLELDPDFFAAYAELAAVPWRQGPLEPKVKELILLAMDAAATHMYEPGVREHTRNALALGATAAEIMEVLELTSTLGDPRVQHRRADPDGGAGGGRAAAGARALRAPARDQGRLHAQPRLLEQRSGTTCSFSTRTSSRPTRSSRRCRGRAGRSSRR